ncbi:hypothetical protein Cflav_PD6114 [Pedosphaera parvula Ellin514]|uniref:Uncharacterized protein n=1 Tax=Pedosphaera parvula (strain Ellin514) TaxID=320771 RepID=B9XP15_PEDPL|nr:hypothetical protein Cflav_PD6114 [Pedosphaera parvula Ellin514]
MYEKGKTDCSGCCLRDGRRDCRHRGPAIGTTQLWKSRLAFRAQYNVSSTHYAAASLETATSDGPRAGVRVGGRYLGMERKRMGVGSRNLGATAVSQGQVGSRPLGPPAWGLSVGWRTLAIRIRPCVPGFVRV